MVRLSGETPPSCRDHVLSAEASCDHPLDARVVRRICPPPATNRCGRSVRGEGSLRGYVAASHLQAHLGHRGSIPAVGPSQHDVADTEVGATQRWPFTGVQQAADANPQGRGDARRSLIVSKLRHYILGCVCIFL